MIEKSKRNLKTLISFSFILSLLLNLGCQGSGKDAGQNGAERLIPSVEAVQTRYGALPLTERLTGVVSAKNRVEIYPEISAAITIVHVQNGDDVKKGGDKMVQFNVEFLLPIIKDAGLVGVLFFDAGNAYDDKEDMDFGDLRKSVGYGFRWYSPIGPMRLEYGHILETDRRGDGEAGDSRWEFSMGMAF